MGSHIYYTNSFSAMANLWQRYISRAFLNNSYTRESESEALLRNMLMYTCMLLVNH